MTYTIKIPGIVDTTVFRTWEAAFRFAIGHNPNHIIIIEHSRDGSRQHHEMESCHEKMDIGGTMYCVGIRHHKYANTTNPWRIICKTYSRAYALRVMRKWGRLGYNSVLDEEQNEDY